MGLAVPVVRLSLALIKRSRLTTIIIPFQYSLNHLDQSTGRLLINLPRTVKTERNFTESSPDVSEWSSSARLVERSSPRGPLLFPEKSLRFRENNKNDGGHLSISRGRRPRLFRKGDVAFTHFAEILEGPSLPGSIYRQKIV